jgi:hypothetical protein
VSTWWKQWTHRAEKSRLFEKDEVNLVKGSMSIRKVKEDWRQEELFNTSGAFDQKQVFPQMLGGYFDKK